MSPAASSNDTVQHQTFPFDPLGFITGHWFTPPLFSGWMISSYLTYSVKWIVSKNVILCGRCTHVSILCACACTHTTHTGVQYPRDTDLEQQCDMAQSDAVYCAWNDQRRHMLLPCTGCGAFSLLEGNKRDQVFFLYINRTCGEDFTKQNSWIKFVL